MEGGEEMPELEIILRLVANVLLYFLLGLTGAFAKDSYDLLQGDIIKIQIRRVVLGGLLTAAMMPLVESLLAMRLSFEAFIALGFLCGVLSFELFGKVSSLRGIKGVAEDAVEIRQILKERKVDKAREGSEESYKNTSQISERPELGQDDSDDN